MKQKHTHKKQKEREEERESVLILTENKEPKNERDFNFAPFPQKKFEKKYFEHHQILSFRGVNQHKL